VSRSGAARESRRARALHGKTKPFATIATTLLASQHLRRLSGAAIRIWLLANASWTPDRPAPLPIDYIAKNLHKAPRTVCTAIRELVASSMLEPHDPAVRPGGMGRKGQAATFNLPHRKPNKPAPIRRDIGDPTLQGTWRVRCDELRKLAAELTDTGILILVCVILPCHRDKHGCPVSAKPFSLAPSELRDMFPKISRATLARVPAELRRLNLIEQIRAPSGRRPALYIRTGLASSGVERTGRRKRRR
jgi:hypothetical protein